MDLQNLTIDFMLDIDQTIDSFLYPFKRDDDFESLEIIKSKLDNGIYKSEKQTSPIYVNQLFEPRIFEFGKWITWVRIESIDELIQLKNSEYEYYDNIEKIYFNGIITDNLDNIIFPSHLNQLSLNSVYSYNERLNYGLRLALKNSHRHNIKFEFIDYNNSNNDDDDNDDDDSSVNDDDDNDDDDSDNDNDDNED